MATRSSTGCTFTTGTCLRRSERGRHPRGVALNLTRDLFRRTSLLFIKYPLLWLPLVIADTLRTLLQWYAQPLTRAALYLAAPRSALGGGIAGPPAQWKISLIAGGIGFLALALGLFLLVYALGVVARAVRPERGVEAQRPELHFQIPTGILPTWLQIAGLALLYFLFLSEFMPSVVLTWAVRRHMTAGHLQLLFFSLAAPALLAVLFLAVQPLRRYVLHVQAADSPFAAERDASREAKLPYFLLLALAALCSNLAALGIAYLTQRALGTVRVAPSMTLLLLQVVTSIATALPYAYAMTGFSLSPATPLGIEDVQS